VIELTDAERRIAQWIAEERQRRNEAAGIRDRSNNPALPGAGPHVVGVPGELAFAKLFNVWPDLDTTPRSGGADCERFGETIDVKTTGHPDEGLWAVTSKSACPPDHYALMGGRNGKYQFHGFIRDDDLVKYGRVTTRYGRQGYEAPLSSLSLTQMKFTW